MQGGGISGRPSPLEVLRLFRLSVAITPLADVWAGYAACVPASPDAGFLNEPKLYIASAASIAVFCFGCSLNDFLDRHKDAESASSRPIPSGGLSTGAAMAAIASTVAAALVLGLLAGWSTFWIVGLLLFLAAAYNLWTRRIQWLGVLNLGCLRALDLLVGVTVAHNLGLEVKYWTLAGPGLPVIPVMILYGLYGCSLSTVALAERTERHLDIRYPAAAAALPALAPVIFLANRGLWFPALILWLVLVLPIFRHFETGARGAEHLVGHLVSGFFLLGALIVLAGEHPLPCIILWLLYFVSRTLSRWIPPA